MTTDLLVRDAIEAEARKVMARRAALKLRWDTREEREALAVEAEVLIDRWLEMGESTAARVPGQTPLDTDGDGRHQQQQATHR